MRRAVCLIALFAVTAIGYSQAKKSPAGPNLRKFSSDELKACFHDKTICGTDDIYAISDELTKRLPAFSTDQLVACFADWKICGVENDIETGWAVSAELDRRGNPHMLLVRYWTEPDELVRDGIMHAASHFKTPEITAFMKKVLAAGQGDEDDLYWPANYLAKRCDPDGLKWLSTREGRPEGCLIWTPTVALFGKCHYRPAIPYLIANSLDDACLNIVDAAETDLRAIYPHSPTDFRSIEEMRKYYCSRALLDSFKVDCGSE
jgi:hypothetical protein